MANYTGGPGNDSFTGDDFADGASGGGGDDVLNGLGGNDWLYGDEDNDRLAGGAGDDMLDGGSGNDVLEGGIGSNRLEGGSGIDTASYANATGAVTVTLPGGRSSGADGTDTLLSIENLIGSGFADWLTGDDGVNVIEGGAGIDALHGNGGNDQLDGGTGDDVMAGGAGDDTFVVDSFGDQVLELVGGGIDTILSSASIGYLSGNVENLIVRVGPAGQPLRQGLGNALNNVLTGIDAVGSTGVNLFGDAGDDSIYGSSGDDMLFGGADNDLLDGGAGQDTMAGGTGDDTYVVDMLNDGLSELANQGTDTVRTALGAYVLGANLEQLIYTGTAGFVGTGNELANTIDARSATAHVSLSGLDGADTLYGGAFLDTLEGGTGSDILRGMGGNDRLDGGPGSDVMEGGAGDDTFIVDSSLDQIVELTGDGTDSVESSSSFSLVGTAVENLILQAGAIGQPLRVGTGNALDNVLTGVGTAGSAGVGLFGEAGSDTLYGSGSDDHLWGGDDNDILRGGDGNDRLNGGAGNDELRGGAGDDRYVVDSNGDQVIEAAGEGIDTVESTISYSLGADLENLILSSAGADQPINEGFGNELDNVLTGVGAVGFYGVSLNGEGGNDTIYGSSGTDFINGGSGDDIIYAGAGFNYIGGGAGNDKMYGGGDSDEFSVNDAGDLVFEAIGQGQDSVLVSTQIWALAAGQEVESLVGLYYGDVQTLSGNEFGQRIESYSTVNILNGLGGNDDLRGFTGNDQLSGGEDDDTLRGGAGEDTLNGDEGNDTLYGEGDADTLNGGTGNDTLDGGAGGDTMDGGTGDDVFLVDDAGDFVFEAPGEGNDRVVASVSWTMTADQEIETLVTSDAAGTGAIDFTGNSAKNRIEGNAGVNVLQGDAGNDTLFGFAGNDELRGGADNDTLDGGTGDDAMYGGAGHDVYLVDSAGDQVVENANEGQDTVRTALNDYTISANVEDLTALAGIIGTFAASGNAGGNRIDASLTSAAILYGYGGNDRLIGGSGNDEFYGGEGVDTISAGGGDDQIFVQNGLDSQIGELVDGGAGTDSITVSGSGQINIYHWTISNVERLQSYVSALGVSTAQYNGFSEVSGNILVADGGTISLANKTVNGTLTLNGDGYTVNLSGVVTSGLKVVGGSGNDSFNGSAGAGAIVQGGAGSDEFNGGADGDSFEGGAGNDWLDGGAGADTLAGAAGDDTYVVDNYGDTVVEALNEGIDTVRTSLMGYALGANVENLIYTGTSPFSGIGNDRANIIDATATATNDLIRAMGGDDTLRGGDGRDTLDGGLGKDMVYGGAGNDVLEVSIPADIVAGEVYDGGDGTDTLRIVAGEADISGVTLTGIERIQASAIRLTVAQADALQEFTGVRMYFTNAGTVSLADMYMQGSLYLSDASGNNVTLGTNQLTVYGGTSDDIITGGANHLIDGGDGNDTLTGSNGFANHLRGGAGSDKLTGGNGVDTLVGGIGVDDIDGGAGDDTIQFLNANEVAVGDKMDGGAGYDVLQWVRTTALDLSGTTIVGIEELRVADPNAGVRMTIEQFAVFQKSNTVIEFVNGGIVSLAGKTTLGVFRLASAATVFDATYVTEVQGGAGDDVISASGLLKGGGGADKLTGGTLDDTLRGEDGNDELRGGAGIDKLYGGVGDDTYFIADADQIFEDADGGADTVSTTLAALTLATNVERLVYTGTGAFTGTGNALANVLDTRAASGNDTLDGGAGIDTMYGGAGDDTYHVDDATDQAMELSGEGNDTVRSTAASYVLGANIETLILAGAAKNGTGNAQDNVLIGNGGHNILDGGAGADRMEGGAGDDTYHVDNANDLIVETGVGLDKAVASVSYTLRAGVSVETLTTSNDAGTGAINLKGNELANRIVGNARANTLNGGGGNDRLEGLDGSDTLWGDAGNDLLYGGNGNDLYVVTDLGDTIVETATGGTDRVSLSLATGGVFTLANYVETLVVAGAGIEAHGNAQDNRIVNSATGSSIWGEGGNDTLEGGAVAEALHGGIGNGRITGGAGNDTMWGDAGNDLFVFATGSGADEVADFTRGADRIDLTGYGISSLAQVQGMMSQSGANAVIDLGGGNSITLDNIVGSQLAASDFVFAAAAPAFAAMALMQDVVLASDDFLSGGGAAKAYIFDL